MNKLIIEEGWISKFSDSVTTSSKNWMVLTEDGLYMSDKTGLSQIYLKASEIKSVNKKNPDSFEIHTSDNSIVFVSDKNPDSWVGALMNLLKSPHKLISQQITSQFASFKQMLAKREKELCKLNRNMFLKQQKFTMKALKEIGEVQIHNESLLNSAQIDKYTPHKAKELKNTDFPLNLAIQFSLNQEIIKEILTKEIAVSIRNPNQISVNRSTITRALKWRYNGIRADAITFAVSHDIILSEIALCRPSSPGELLHIQKFFILKGNNTAASSIYEHHEDSAVVSHQRESVQSIKMHGGVRLNRNQYYTAYLVLEGESSYKCVDCFLTVEAKGVLWKFYNTVFTRGHFSNKTDISCGIISGFTFTKI